MAPLPRRDRPSPVASSVAADDAPELPVLRRPSPRPHRSELAVTGSTFFDRPVDEDDEDDERRGLLARAAGLAAGLRSNPRTVRHGSLGVIGAGVALFVAAGLSTPLASAETDQQSIAADRALSTAVQRLGPAAAASPAGVQLLNRRPTHTTTQAPVDHRTISGLAANGIPEVALNAYRVAAARMRHVDPGCGIDWALLAGIGREESDHGRFAGAKLLADGTSTPRIVGPALDGKHWDFIAAPTNGVALAGDATYAHALGPMQFIPSTWASYGTDANGDGKADIFNINDAALGAARYLCAAGGNLRTHAGQVAAVLAYNHSDQYLAQVLALADAYRRGIPVTGIPVGNTTGALPKVVSTGNLPPVNPAAPTAAHRAADKKAAAKRAAATKAADERAAARRAAARRGGPTSGAGTSGATKSTGGLEPGKGPTTSTSTTTPPAGGGSSSATPSETPSSGPSSTTDAPGLPICIPIPGLVTC